MQPVRAGTFAYVLHYVGGWIQCFLCSFSPKNLGFITVYFLLDSLFCKIKALIFFFFYKNKCCLDTKFMTKKSPVSKDIFVAAFGTGTLAIGSTNCPTTNLQSKCYSDKRRYFEI